MNRRATIEVFGRVQGVFLRVMTRKQAVQLRLRGYVENTGRGTLRILVAGPEASINALVQWLETSPGAAHVDRVAITWDNGPEDGITDFSIR